MAQAAHTDDQDQAASQGSAQDTAQEAGGQSVSTAQARGTGSQAQPTTTAPAHKMDGDAGQDSARQDTPPLVFSPPIGTPAPPPGTLLKGTLREQAELYYTQLFSLVSSSPSEFHTASRQLCLNDLYFLLGWVLRRPDIKEDWLFDRCRMVENAPDGYIDLWSREHFKSSIITFGLTIQDILKNPEVTFGFFSHTRPIAKGFLSQIKLEFEGNRLLQQLFPDVLYKNPKVESPRWSLDGGIIVRRKGNPKEATVEAHGLVDGQPTSRHFQKLVYDDVVTLESVNTPEMIYKTTTALELSYNLGSQGGSRRFIGTIYHFNDTYRTVMDRGTAIPRIFPATKDGTEAGEPVLLTPQALREKRRDMGPYVFACQMLLNPVADKAQGFRVEWLKYWKAREYARLNLYLLCDPASEKKKHSDYTAMAVVGLGSDQCLYIVTMIRDRLNLTERGRMLMELHRQYRPIAVGYEKYGKDSDIEHIETVQEQENYRFAITPLGGQMKKEDRIKRLVPDCENGLFYLPAQCIRDNYEGRQEDLTKVFTYDEYIPFPVGSHDDLLDCISRIKDPDLNAVYPKDSVRPLRRPNRSARVA